MLKLTLSGIALLLTGALLVVASHVDVAGPRILSAADMDAMVGGTCGHGCSNVALPCPKDCAESTKSARTTGWWYLTRIGDAKECEGDPAASCHLSNAADCCRNFGNCDNDTCENCEFNYTYQNYPTKCS